jgi:hypothetical protein
MTTRKMLPRTWRPTEEARVWIDHEHAVISGATHAHDTVELLEREPGESESTFEARAVHELVDEPRIVVSGPAFARTGFERAYVAITHRPDRLVEAG